ncbi:putative glutathione transferase [Helianthus annuus]|nr:putative glutathione transferase [Helianthus annuus]
MIYEGAKKIMMSKGEERQKAVDEFLGYLKVLENKLGEKPYFNCDSAVFENDKILLGPVRNKKNWAPPYNI